MGKFIISYDLRVPETHTDYISLTEHIKSLYSSWARPVKSVWFIESSKDAEQIRNEIKSILDNNDKLIVMELEGDWATYNIDMEVTEWMKNNL